MSASFLELLAPARDAEVGRQAVLHGADAVYIGGPSHGARAAASNSIADIASLCDFAHQYYARVYATVNTLAYDSELRAVERQVRDLWRAGVDALIVQDMGLLRLDLPPIALHASTQCDIRTPEKGAFLARCGFSQLVLPRELSEAEIIEMRRAVPADVALEAFVHGALCVSYSGDCQASCASCGRSANRGECAQMCRMAYDLVDASGRVLVKDKHLLSLRDLNRLSDLQAMAAAGIASFKIEGRLKDAAYVKTVVAAYRRALDSLIAANPTLYKRSSLGSASVCFDPDVDKAFNRGFTRYFFDPSSAKSMACIDTPKWIGERVGTAGRTSGGKLFMSTLDRPLNNGDGLGYFGRDGKYAGFRVNRAEGRTIFPASHIDVAAGAALYRNADAKQDALMARETATRVIDIDMRLRSAGPASTLFNASPPERLVLELAIPAAGLRCVCSADCPVDQAKQPQISSRRSTLSKLGGTAFSLRELADELDPMAFVPASALANLRRQAISLLQSQMRATYPRDLRRPEDQTAPYPACDLTYHANVANAKAREFYLSHGVERIEPAFETQRPAGKPVVMTTRYCIRRELGACLRDGGASKLPSPLYLQNKAVRYGLHFDCANCRMELTHES